MNLRRVVTRLREVVRESRNVGQPPPASPVPSMLLCEFCDLDPIAAFKWLRMRLIYGPHAALRCCSACTEMLGRPQPKERAMA